MTYMWNLKYATKDQIIFDRLVISDSLQPHGSSVHGILHAGVGCHFLLQGTLYTKQKQTHRHRKQTCHFQRGMRMGKDKLGV